MNKLKPGIKIYSDYNGGTLQINSGVLHHTQQESNEFIFRGEKFLQQYEPEAYLPKRDWRTPDAEEYKIIIGDHKNKKDYNSVFTGELPENIRSLFSELDLGTSITEEEVFNKFRQHKELVDQINIHINEFLQRISLAPFRFMSLATNYANSEIVSLDKRRMPAGYSINDLQFIGVHKDSSKNMTLHNSHTFGNRITFNLGQESRYLLLMNLSMIQAYNMIKKEIDLKENEVNNKNITSYFMKLFPDYPMLKIEHKPHHFYIAPTDNCFHDGSTLGSTSLDIVMIYLGKFLI
ncbi:hypothetical protein MKJ01_09090 [Chryseobacterium sp. SSA4.19]|uniref:hypothetical protein n=1 Tax=Chryseobacterium sp. SSA4.19 TaxID=2919915 RepID=UPI001F4E076D|nr:hypothetical protein [Chryseobacterium sp. SSA4.19]MCJ8153909.1 hypothetical protein [Chryseobacterium sp. SSA4.19]